MQLANYLTVPPPHLVQSDRTPPYITFTSVRACVRACVCVCVCVCMCVKMMVSMTERRMRYGFSLMLMLFHKIFY